MPMATGTFEVTPGSEAPFHEAEGEAKLTHANGTQKFNGGIQGDGSIEWLMCYLPSGTARFVGLQRIDGSVGGRQGTFLIEAIGVHAEKASEASWRVIVGSGTGELEGITGAGGFDAPGGRTVSYHLDYRFE